MKAIKAVVQNGRVKLDEPLQDKGRYDAVLVLMDPDPWESILHDPRPRKHLVAARQKALADFAAGKTQPIISSQRS